MENKETMREHLERAEAVARMLREIGPKMEEASEVERDMIVRLYKEMCFTMSEEILSACMKGLAGRLPVNRAMLPFVAGAFDAAKELCLNSLGGGELSDKDRAELDEITAEVSKMLVENSTVVTVKSKIGEDKGESENG